MNWDSAASLDEIWHSPAFPMWLTLAAAGVFGIILFVTLFRAERSVANGALTVITLLAIGIAVAATIRSYGPGAPSPRLAEPHAPGHMVASLPALSCIDDLAGEPVQLACEKALFGSPEAAASAVAYTAAQLDRLMALADTASDPTTMPPGLLALRRALQRDRYGLVAQVLVARDKCTPADCAAFRVLTERQQIVNNMDAHVYDGLVARYATSWNVPIGTAALNSGPPPSLPTGKPTNAEFPSAASTPAVSIMSAEPAAGAARPLNPATPAAPAQPARPATAASAQTPASPSAKKPPAKSRPQASAPVQLSPSTSSTAQPEAAGSASE